MTGLELLERAAQAAGLEYTTTDGMERLVVRRADGLRCPWDPLNDDGDALRLASRLRLSITMYDEGVTTRHFSRVTKTLGSENGREDAATRRAIVTAAAAMWLNHLDGMNNDDIPSAAVAGGGWSALKMVMTNGDGRLADARKSED